MFGKDIDGIREYGGVEGKDDGVEGVSDGGNLHDVMPGDRADLGTHDGDLVLFEFLG